MQRLFVKNFGPIDHIELEIQDDDILIFIGPQAAGKSTISKAIYFFKSIQFILFQLFLEAIEKKHLINADISSSFSAKIQSRFVKIWGTIPQDNDYLLKYFYNNENFIIINRGNTGKCIRCEISENLLNEILTLKEKINVFIEKSVKQNGNQSFLSDSDILKLDTEKSVFIASIENDLYELFKEKNDLNFIPAGRSIISVLSDQMQNVSTAQLDYLSEEFIKRINNLKPLFKRGMNSLPISIINSLNKAPSKRVKKIEEIVSQVLKADYRYSDQDGDVLFFDKEHFTQIHFASSGQQEALWILLLIIYFVLSNQKCFTVFEEPEAHLYPEAQKSIVDAIALLANINDNQIIITTHSPYILTAFNNLLYAYNLGTKIIDKEKLNTIIDDSFHIDNERVKAYFVENGGIRSIMDEETGLIHSEEIDRASGSMNEVFDKLFDLDSE